jgi:hypothetical protein
MSATWRLMPILALLAMFTACGETADRPAETDRLPDAEPVPEWVSHVAAVADAIEARPIAVDSILQAHDMTRAVFDSLLYEVAADPTLTAAYEEARRK